MEPIIHAYTEVEQNMGDHGRIVVVPISVTPETTLRELINMAGLKQKHHYVPPGVEPWEKLTPFERIIVAVEQPE